jgi:hypothetical protein
MPEPKTKTRIIMQLKAERKRLESNLATLTPAQMVESGVIGEWSVKDVLAHLADWEAHMPVWVAAARQGDPVAEIEPGLNWTQFNEFNRRIYERHKNQSLEEVLAYFHDIHNKFMEMVDAMPEEEMLERKRYPFLDKGAIYDWLSADAGHDRWAKTNIRKWLKTGNQ